MAEVRTIVTDVDASAAFYTSRLGFSLMQQYGPAMAIVAHGDLRLWLAGPMASASRPMPDGRKPEPGGWTRIALTVDDLAETVARLKAAGGLFRNDIATGPGGSQILLEDPCGNVVELFQAR